MGLRSRPEREPSGGVPSAGPGPLQGLLGTGETIDDLGVVVPPDEVHGRLVQFPAGDGAEGVGRRRHISAVEDVPVVLLGQPGRNVFEPAEGRTHAASRLDQSPALTGVESDPTPIAFAQLCQAPIFLHPPDPVRPDQGAACATMNHMRTYVRISLPRSVNRVSAGRPRYWPPACPGPPDRPPSPRPRAAPG